MAVTTKAANVSRAGFYKVPTVAITRWAGSKRWPSPRSTSLGFRVSGAHTRLYLGAAIPLYVTFVQAHRAVKLVELNAHNAACLTETNDAATPLYLSHHPALSKSAQANSIIETKLPV